MASEVDRKRYLHLIVCLLPRCNRDMMEILFVFLKWVASFSHVDEETGSKMDLENLATVITPSILYSKNGEPGPAESFKSIKAVSQLLHCQDEFYTVPDELLPYLDPNIVDFFEKNPELPPKDMLKTCSKVRFRLGHRLAVTTDLLLVSTPAQIHTQIGEHRRTKREGRNTPLPPPSRSDSGPPSRLSSYRSDTNLSDRNFSGTPSIAPSNGSTIVDHEHRVPSSSSNRPTSWANEQRPPVRPGAQHQPLSNSSSHSFEPASPRKTSLPPAPPASMHSPMSPQGSSDPDPRRSYHAPAQPPFPPTNLGRPAAYPRS